MKKYFKEYDYDRWTWLRIFPQYSQMEKEYGEMTKQLDDDNQHIAKLKKRQEALIKNSKKLKEKIESLEKEISLYKNQKKIKESKGVKDGKKGNRRSR